MEMPKPSDLVMAGKAGLVAQLRAVPAAGTDGAAPITRTPPPAPGVRTRSPPCAAASAAISDADSTSATRKVGLPGIAVKF